MFNLPPGLSAIQRPIIHLKFPTLSQNPNLFHGIFTRMGGVSNRPFHSLNTSYSVGDQPQNVTANLERIKAAAGARSLQFMIQQHGTGIVVLRRDPSSEMAEPPPPTP